MLKRSFDLVLAAIGLLLALPLLLVLAAAIKLESRGPVFYRGLRAGCGGRPFRIFKLRSMVVDAEAVGGPSTAGDDPRITRVGAFVRRFKLDELPQLLNVLNGTMSFVGPRPEVLSEVAEYDQEQRRVLELRPGITDWATIWNADEGAVLAGADDPHQAYKELIQPTKLRLQLRYYESRSLWIDLKIILCTLIKMVRKEWLPAELRSYGVPLAAGKPDDTTEER
jgi:lipopolysaccharide/colanic/teichoic acid biosynthesis glycosyltransferase